MIPELSPNGIAILVGLTFAPGLILLCWLTDKPRDRKREERPPSVSLRLRP